MSEAAPGPGWWKASDGNWYPPQPARPSGPTKRSRGCLWPLGIGLVILVVVIVAAIAGSGGEGGSGGEPSGASRSTTGGVQTNSGNREHPPPEDVEVDRCYADELGQLQADLKVTNHSSKRSNYIITVAFESRDGSVQYDTSIAFVNDLEPGQATTVEAITFTDAPADFTCKVTEVERFAA